MPQVRSTTRIQQAILPRAQKTTAIVMSHVESAVVTRTKVSPPPRKYHHLIHHALPIKGPHMLSLFGREMVQNLEKLLAMFGFLLPPAGGRVHFKVLRPNGKHLLTVFKRQSAQRAFAFNIFWHAPHPASRVQLMNLFLQDGVG